jgi:hypothetical protein
MEKIDRLGWAAGFSFTSFGVKVGVRTNRHEMISLIQQHLPPGAGKSKLRYVDLLYSFRFADPPRRPGTRTYHLLYEEFVQIARTEQVGEMLGAFRSSVEYFVPQLAPKLLFVHAGVVGWKDSAIVIPGRSFSGKSRFVAAMVKAGAAYYSDEFAVIDQQGLVHPYARPLSIRHEQEAIGRPVSAESIGGTTGTKPIPVAAVISSTYREGARWNPRSLPRGKGILELLSNTVPARKRPAEALAALRRATENARFLKGTRGEADEIAGKILQQIGPGIGS